MSFNIDELRKIRKATSGSEKSKNKISKYIIKMKDKIENVNKLNPEYRKKELINLMNKESQKRKEALNSRISSYADPNWAAPAACESWLYCILTNNKDEIEKANQIINELANSKRINELKKSNYIGYIFILVFFPLTFYFINWWSALIIFFIGTIIIGWKKRYD